MFHVPHNFRIRAHPALGSTDAAGNNGAFLVPFQQFELRCIASDGAGWEHVSVSLAHRCPNWQEMSFVKGLFWDDTDVVVEFHPAKANYVNCHPTTLHLWRPIRRVIPQPPAILVGPLASEVKDDGTVRISLHKAVMELFEAGGLGRPALVMAFALPPKYDDVHYVTDVSKADAVRLLTELLTKIQKGGTDDAVDATEKPTEEHPA